MNLQQQLTTAGLAVFPCRPDKTPAIPRGTSWREVDPETIAWPPDGYVGIAVPPGVIVVDLDLYKGVTRAAVEQALGCELPWDTALIQTTQHGGEHYAFRTDKPIRQGSDLLDTVGLDTRVGGKGYICTGPPGYNGYGCGVFRLAAADSLPALPHRATVSLEHVATTSHTLSDGPQDADTVTEALRHIDPACDRAKWVKVGMALRAWTGDPTLFNEWSSGHLGGHPAPHNYVPEHIEHQWASFKPTGDTTLASLFYEAVKGGWRPSTAAAFGPDGDDMVERILASGCDPRATEGLLAELQAAGGSRLHQATLLALLTRELKDAGLLTTPVRQQLDTLARPKVPGTYGGNHTENATLFMARHYPQGELCWSDQTWYEFTGRAWAERDGDDILHALTVDMLSSLPQHANITGTYGVLGRLAHKNQVRINTMPAHLILFQNGILDLSTGRLLPHSPEYFTTNILPYDYLPDAPAPHWIGFLNAVFEGDQECITLLQEWFGYMISNSIRYHKILFMIGPRRSGKGTIGRVMEQVVGTYNYTGCGLHSFASDSFVDSLRTRSVAFSGDTSRRVSPYSVDVVIARLKQISGGDAVAFDRKYKGSISQTLPTRIILAGNSIPRLFDDSGALASRMLVLPFDVSYIDREDYELEGRLMTELAGIAAWSLEGLRRLTTNGRFTHPEASQAEEDHMAETYSPLEAFIRDVCTFTREHDDRISSTDIHNVYRAWAIGEGESILSRRAFVTALKDVTRGRGCRYAVHLIDGRRQRGFSGVHVAPVATAFIKAAG